MIEFQCDYAEGAHPKILERMIETNMDQTPGYGLDPYCDEAKRLIRKACGREGQLRQQDIKYWHCHAAVKERLQRSRLRQLMRHI